MSKIARILEMMDGYEVGCCDDCRKPAAETEAALIEYFDSIIGEEVDMGDFKDWYTATKNYGGTREEFDRLCSIVNIENNFRAELKKRIRSEG